MPENVISVDSSNRISTVDLADLLDHQLTQLFNHPELADKLPPLMIWGAPGIGKSTIIRNIAKKRGIQFIDVRLAQREPVDVRGLPVPDPEHNSVRWLVSDDWPRDPDSKGIILFDELTAADRSLQVAAYEFILDRRLGGLYQVPKGWYICAAGNRVEDAAVSMTMSSALANRFMHVELREDAEQWVNWGIENGLHPAVVAFIRYRPQYLFHQEKENLERGWPSPRSWERVSVMLQTSEGLDERIVNRIIYGLVGNAAGVEFCAFRKISQEFDNVREIMLNPQSRINVPDKADRKFAFCSAVVYHLWRGNDEDEQQKLLSGFFRILMEMSADFSTMMMMDSLRGNGDKIVMAHASLIYTHPGYKVWEKRFGDAMKSRISKGRC